MNVLVNIVFSNDDNVKFGMSLTLIYIFLTSVTLKEFECLIGKAK